MALRAATLVCLLACGGAVVLTGTAGLDKRPGVKLSTNFTGAAERRRHAGRRRLNRLLRLISTAGSSRIFADKSAAAREEGRWQLVFRQTEGSFKGIAEWESLESPPMDPPPVQGDYSLLKSLGDYSLEKEDGSHEFRLKLVWPNSVVKDLEWTQPSNPMETPAAAADSVEWRGYLAHNGDKCLMDGSRDGPPGDQPWYAVGAAEPLEMEGVTGIPGPRPVVVPSVELYAWVADEDAAESGNDGEKNVVDDLGNLIAKMHDSDIWKDAEAIVVKQREEVQEKIKPVVDDVIMPAVGTAKEAVKPYIEAGQEAIKPLAGMALVALNNLDELLTKKGIKLKAVFDRARAGVSWLAGVPPPDEATGEEEE